MTDAPRATMSLHLGHAPADRARRDPDRPLRLLVCADLSGQSVREARGVLAERAAIRIDIDSAPRVFARLAPAIRLESIPGESPVLDFERIEDFHPESLIRRLPLLAALRELGASGGGEAPSPGPTPPPPSAPSGSDMQADLQRLLGRAPSAAPAVPAARSVVDSLIRGIVAPAVPAAPAPDPTRATAAAGALTLLLRQVLRDPAFRRLESTWLAVDRLIKDLGGDDSIEIWLFDISCDELLDDLVAHRESLRDCAVGRCLLGSPRNLHPGPWAMIALDHLVAADAPGLISLAAMGSLAEAAGASLLAGTSALDASTPDGPAPNPVMAWATLDVSEVRRLSAARHIGVAAGLVLARQPYGQRSDPVEGLAFEEIDDPGDADQYAWSAPALYLAQLAARAFRDQGWQAQLDAQRDIDDLPAFSFRDAAGEPQLRASTRTLISDEMIDRWLAAGVMPITGSAHQPIARLARWQSFGDPLGSLQGPWD